MYNNEKVTQRRKFNNDLQEEIQMLRKKTKDSISEHVLQRSEGGINRTVIDQKSMGKNPQSWQNTTQMDVVEEEQEQEYKIRKKQFSIEKNGKSL